MDLACTSGAEKPTCRSTTNNANCVGMASVEIERTCTQGHVGVHQESMELWVELSGLTPNSYPKSYFDSECCSVAAPLGTTRKHPTRGRAIPTCCLAMLCDQTNCKQRIQTLNFKP